MYATLLTTCVCNLYISGGVITCLMKMEKKKRLSDPCSVQVQCIYKRSVIITGYLSLPFYKSCYETGLQLVPAVYVPVHI